MFVRTEKDSKRIGETSSIIKDEPSLLDCFLPSTLMEKTWMKETFFHFLLSFSCMPEKILLPCKAL